MSDDGKEPFLAQVLSAYLANNIVNPIDLPFVIATVKMAFSGDNPFPKMSFDGVSPFSFEANGFEQKKSAPPIPTKAEPEAPVKLQLAVPVKNAVTPDAVTCFCCGKSFKHLKRHLMSAHQLSPDQYRAAYNLDADYPIVASNFSERRSMIAKSIGLGRNNGQSRRFGERKSTRKRAPT